MSDGTPEAGAQETTTTSTETAAPQVDTQQIVEAIGTLNQRVDQRLGDYGSTLQQFIQSQQPEEPNPLDTVDFEGMFNGAQVDPNQMRDVFSQLLQQHSQQIEGTYEQKLDAAMQEFNDLRLKYETTSLEQREPDLQDPANAKAAVDRNVEFVQSLGLPQDIAVQLMRSTAMIERAWQELKPGVAGTQEVPANGARQGIELGGGGAAVQTDSTDDPAQRIVQAGGASTWLY